MLTSIEKTRALNCINRLESLINKHSNTYGMSNLHIENNKIMYTDMIKNIKSQIYKNKSFDEIQKICSQYGGSSHNIKKLIKKIFK